MLGKTYCILCGVISTSKICINCQFSLFQIKELKKVLEESLRSNRMPPEWATKAAKKIKEILEYYPEFAVYKNVISELVWTYIIDDEATREGLPIDELVQLSYTHKNRDEIIKDLEDIKIVNISTDRRLFPGEMLTPLLEVKKVYGDDFNTPNWNYYVSAIQSIFILNLVERMISSYISTGYVRRPLFALLIFKILSKVIIHYMSEKDLNDVDNFHVSEMDVSALLTILGNKRTQMKFIVNVTGIIDGESKLFQDYDEENKKFLIHEDWNEYIKIMIERIREVERERDR